MMKKILLLILLLIGFNTSAQVYDNLRLDRKELPAYLIANENDTIGIVFTINDVQKIDRNLELLEYMEKSQAKIDTTLYYYTSLNSDLEKKIQLQTGKILNFISQSIVRDRMIEDLKSDIKKADETINNLNKISKNKDSIIEEKDKEIKKQKGLKFLFGSVGLIIIVVIAIL